MHELCGREHLLKLVWDDSILQLGITSSFVCSFHDAVRIISFLVGLQVIFEVVVRERFKASKTIFCIQILRRIKSVFLGIMGKSLHVESEDV